MAQAVERKFRLIDSMIRRCPCYEIYFLEQLNLPKPGGQRTVSNDDWEQFTKGVKPMKQDKVIPEKPKPAPACRLAKRARSQNNLAQRFLEVESSRQAHNLSSHVYKNLGIGAPPISGGKIEGKKRTRR